MDSFNKEFSKSILNKGADISKDLAEIGLDSILNDGLLKDVPVISALTALFKMGKTISGSHFIKKLILFLYEFNNASIDSDKLELFKNKFESNKNYEKKVLESLILIIDRFDKEFKSKIFALLFSEYLNETYSWDEFQDLSRIIELLFISDIKIIRYLIEKNQSLMIKEINIKDFSSGTISGAIERLKTYGFLTLYKDIYDDEGTYELYKTMLTKSGKKFYNLCLHKCIEIIIS